MFQIHRALNSISAPDMTDAPYLVDYSSIHGAWPTAHEPPQLLHDLATLVARWTNASMGHFAFQGSRFDDYWIELGGDLSEQFGTFLSFADGSRIALWMHEGSVAGAEPVVLIGGEGDLRVLASNLNAFLQAWADMRTGTELDEPPDIAAAASLAERATAAAQLSAFLQSAPELVSCAPVGDLKIFMNEWQTNAIARMNADPVLLAISRLLYNRIPRGQEYNPPTSIQIRVAGSRIEFQTNALPPDYTTFAPLPERDALIPLILRA
jgi:hypothetical protein